MTKAEIMQHICRVVTEDLGIQTNEALQGHTRLNEDLGIDSVRALELLLHLELTQGFVIPDDMMTQEDFRTLETLTQFLSTCHQEEGRIYD